LLGGKTLEPQLTLAIAIYSHAAVEVASAQHRRSRTRARQT
jgi:hypothetical protein